MNRYFILLILLTTLIKVSEAQKYSTAIGIRLSDGRYGLSGRYAFTEALTTEAIVDFQADEWAIYALPKYHFKVIGRGLNFYLGAGMHYGRLKNFGAIYGVDALAGFEFRIPVLPFTISTEIKPAYHIQHEDWFEFPATLSVHYLIDKRSPKKRKRIRARKKRKEERRERKEERGGKLFVLPWNKK